MAVVPPPKSSCFAPWNNDVVKLNMWSVNIMPMDLYVSSYWQDYPGLQDALIVLFAYKMAVIVGSLIALTIFMVRNVSRRSVFDNYVADPSMRRSGVVCTSTPSSSSSGRWPFVCLHLFRSERSWFRCDAVDSGTGLGRDRSHDPTLHVVH